MKAQNVYTLLASTRMTIKNGQLKPVVQGFMPVENTWATLVFRSLIYGHKGLHYNFFSKPNPKIFEISWTSHPEPCPDENQDCSRISPNWINGWDAESEFSMTVFFSALKMLETNSQPFM